MKTMYKWSARVAICVISVLTMGCATQKQCSNKFPCPENNDVLKVYIDTLRVDTAYVIMPADTVQIHTKVPCDDFKTELKSGKKKVNISVVGGVMNASCISEIDSLQYIIYAKDKYINEIKNTTKIITKIENRLTLYHWIKIFSACLLFFLIGAFIGFIKS